jgi:hypothetical protein
VQPASNGNTDMLRRNFRRVVFSMTGESTPAEGTQPEL